MLYKEPEYELIPELEMLLNEGQHSRYSNGNYPLYRENEYEDSGTAIAKPKTIWRHNTELNGPCFAGNFDFLYNGGANEATATFNTKISFRQNFPAQQKNDFINNLKRAAAAAGRRAHRRGGANRGVRLLAAAAGAEDETRSPGPAAAAPG